MSDLFLNTKQVSELLNINEKKVYVLAQEGKIPATILTGKWLFPKNQIENYIQKKAFENVENLNIYSNILLTAGSDDPIISFIQESYRTYNNNFLMYTSTVGSKNGLNYLVDNKCNISFSHLFDSNTNEFNFKLIEDISNINEFVIINLFYRNIGFLSKSDNISSFRNISEKKLKFINRQKGSGIRHFTDNLLKNEGLSDKNIIEYDNNVNTHFEIALNILNENSNVGIATQYFSKLFKLNFHFLFKERFDIILKKDFFFNKNIQNLLNMLKESSFQNKLKYFFGYDFVDTGKIMFKNWLLIFELPNIIDLIID